MHCALRAFSCITLYIFVEKIRGSKERSYHSSFQIVVRIELVAFLFQLLRLAQRLQQVHSLLGCSELL